MYLFFCLALLLLLLLLLSSLHTGCSRCSFPWTSGAPHHSGFKLRTGAIYLVCAMFPGWLFSCGESMECLPGILPRYVLKPLSIAPVAPVTTGITEHFMLHIRCIFMHRFLYFNFCPLFYVLHSCLMALIHLSVCKFSLLYYYIWFIIIIIIIIIIIRFFPQGHYYSPALEELKLRTLRICFIVIFVDLPCFVFHLCFDTCVCFRLSSCLFNN
jgi:hypothetical protein